MRFIKTTFATPWICLWMSNFKFKLVNGLQAICMGFDPLYLSSVFFDPHILTMEFGIDRWRYFEFVPEIKLMFGNFRIVTRMSKCILINALLMTLIWPMCLLHVKANWNPTKMWADIREWRRRISRGRGMETVNPIYILISVKPFLWHLGSGQESELSLLPSAGVCVTSRQ